MLPVEKDPEPGVFVPVDELPVAVHCAEAHYPDLPREAGVEGTVRVLMLVGLDGRVERAIIAPGGSVPMLDEAALAASRECVFTPALTNNHPVKVWVARNYRFSLH
jgi:protein TonB